jgi:aminoglycoside 6-adenylyltransferase
MARPLTYADLEAALLRWAPTQPALRALLVVGSRARRHPPPDPWSDLDLVLFLLDPAPYVASPAWIEALAPAWLTVPDHTGAGDPEWYALFEGGLKADFVLSRADPAATTLEALLQASPYRNVFHRGLRPMYTAFSPGQPPAAPVLPPPRPFNRPIPDQFHHHATHTLLLASRTARLVLRGDHWRARDHLECRLRPRLLAMLEWHAQAASPHHPPDTWHDGRFIETWASPVALAALPATLPTGEFTASTTPALRGISTAPATPGLWPALLALLDLYHRLALEVASAWSLPYPHAAHAHVRRWLADISPAP